MTSGNLILTRKVSHVITRYLVGLAGMVLIIAGFILHWELILVGLALLLLPWISRQWMFPHRILFKKGEVILETGQVIPNIHRIPGAQINEIEIEKLEKDSEPHSFREESQSTTYKFYLDTADSRYRLLRLTFSQNEDAKVEEISKFVRNFLSIVKH